MENKLIVSLSPHVHGGDSVQKNMYGVLIALIPAFLVSLYFFGLGALIVTATSVAACLFFEWAIGKYLMKKPTTTICDGSAIITGVLLAFNLPSNLPIWIIILGALFAIGVGKMSFGGLGCNPFNPALAGRCFLLIAFAGLMTNFPSVDAVSTATPLAVLKNGGTQSLSDMFFGFTSGTIGEVSALLLLAGGIYLLVKKVITWEIPVIYIGVFAVFMILFGGHGFDVNYVLCEICGGGLMLGAFFMATDYVSSPITFKGRVVFAICLGLLTGLIRVFSKSAEGVSYAIIFCNLLVPIIEKATKPVAFGKGGKKA